MLEMAEAFRAALAAFDPGGLSADDCFVVAERLGAVEKACAAARARAAARAVACGAHRERGFADGADWLAEVAGSSVGEARSALETVAALERCPAAKEAVASGEVSIRQAEVIVGTEAEVSGSEADLVALARRSALGPVRDEARRRRLGAVAAEELHERQHRARSLRHWRDDEGMVRLCGALPPLIGVPLMNRLDAETDRIRRGARAVGSDEPRDAHAADALVKLLSGQGKGRATSAEVVVVADVRAYRRGQARPGEVCHIVGGGPVPVEVVRRLVDGDAFVKAVVHDGVRIDTVVHYGRHIPAELRTALELGPVPGFDGAVCVEAGCERRSGLEWDHLDPVANGGVTSFDNLAPRCWPHHRAKTERDRHAGLLGAGMPP